jgi:hypothetical protein
MPIVALVLAGGCVALTYVLPVGDTAETLRRIGFGSAAMAAGWIVTRTLVMHVFGRRGRRQDEQEVRR